MRDAREAAIEVALWKKRYTQLLLMVLPEAFLNTGDCVVSMNAEHAHYTAIDSIAADQKEIFCLRKEVATLRSELEKATPSGEASKT